MRRLTPVESSTVAAIGHDGQDLWVAFHSNSRLYRYRGVSREQFSEFLLTPSKGQWINQFKLFKQGELVDEAWEAKAAALSLRELLPGPSFGF